LPYWREDAYYSLTAEETETLATAASTVNMLLENALNKIYVDDKRFRQMMKIEDYPNASEMMLKTSWEEHQPGTSTRIRLAWNPQEEGEPVLLNAYPATPMGMAEQQAQQAWSEDMFLTPHQFATLDISLIDALQQKQEQYPLLHIFVTTLDSANEMLSNMVYWLGRANEAKIETVAAFWEAMRYSSSEAAWVDQYGNSIQAAYSCLPLPFLLNSETGEHLMKHPASLPFVEPAWRGPLGSNLVMAATWALNKDHPNLLETRIGNPHELADPAVFPLSAAYASMPVAQARSPYGRFGENNEFAPEFDVWLINGDPVALSIREYELGPGSLTVSAIPHQIVP
jgi:glutathionylspermidine synthase